jgi:FkbM family methyltransferase
MNATQETPPFGTHALSGWDAHIVGLTRAMPQGWAGKRLALLLRKLARGAMARPVDIAVFGHKMRLDGTRNIAERRLLIQPQHFDPAERAALANALKPGDTAVDIGSNIGAYTLFMAGLVGALGRVLAVEPQPAVLARLRVNCSFNPDLKIDIAATALGDRDGEAHFELNPTNQGESKLIVRGTGTIAVPLTTLQAALTSRGIDRVAALKIDVEGAEPEVLLPFFANAPISLWPKLMILERGDSRWKVDLTGALMAKGYRQQSATRLNLILTRT